jgi:hypothetical protein
MRRPSPVVAGAVGGALFLGVLSMMAAYQPPFTSTPPPFAVTDPLALGALSVSGNLGVDGGAYVQDLRAVSATLQQARVAGNAGVDGGLTVAGDVNGGGFGTFGDVAAATVTATADTSSALGSNGGAEIVGGGKFSCTEGRVPGQGCLDVRGAVSANQYGHTFACAESTLVRTAVYLYDNSGTATVGPADSENANKVAVGVVASKPTTTTCTVVALGMVTGYDSLTPNARQYLGTDGGITESAPNAGGSIVQHIGRANSATDVFVQTSPTYTAN